MSDDNIKKLFDNIVKELSINKVSFKKWNQYYGAYMDTIKLNVSGMNYRKVGLALLESSVMFSYDVQQSEWQSKIARLIIFLDALDKYNTAETIPSVADVYASCFDNGDTKAKN